MRFVILGCGSIGTRHSVNLKASGHEVTLIDIDVNKALDLRRAQLEFDAAVASSLGAAVDWDAEAVIIATPPDSHVRLALEAVRSGMPVFIEKPLSPSLDCVDTLIAGVEERGLVAQMGMNLRFHRDLMDLKQRILDGQLGQVLHVRAEFGQWLPDWRPNRDYRQTYSASKAEGGGAIMDAAVHEIDYVRWLVGSEVVEVTALTARTGALEIDCEDTAEVWYLGRLW